MFQTNLAVALQQFGKMKTFFKDPLLHFFILGGLIFGLYAYKHPLGDTSKTIIVSHPQLLEYIQYQRQNFNDTEAKKVLKALSASQKQQLINDFVKDEVLLREAKALHLEQGDRVMRKRLLQKLDFMTQAVSEKMIEHDRKAIKAFFAQHQSNYTVSPSIDFTHVYFSEEQGFEAAKQRAYRTLKEVKAKQADFASAPLYGDQFMFHVNYVARTPEYINSHFGEDFKAVIFSNDTPLNSWVGPFRSEHGMHVVMVSKRQSGYIPHIDEVYGQVKKDYIKVQKQVRQDKVIQGIIDGYKVKINL